MKLILSFVVSSTCLLGTFLISDNQLPGALMSIECQQAVHGMACGEFPAQTGNCSVPAAPCAQVATVVAGAVGNDCAPVGALCGDCTAGNITCNGGYDPAGTHLCFLTTPPCCAQATCANAGAWVHSCNCDGPAGAPAGTRMLAGVTYNVPSGCP